MSTRPVDPLTASHIVSHDGTVEYCPEGNYIHTVSDTGEIATCHQNGINEI